MDLTDRARLVRAFRVEMKQEAVYHVARHDQERVERPLRRVRRSIDRAGARVGRFVDGQLAAHRRRETARLRQMNMRVAERQRTQGYDITPEFRRRSAAIGARATATSFRAQAGSGSNRWRGSVAEIGREARAARPQPPAPPPALIDQLPGEASFAEPRRRNPRGRIVTRRN